MVFAMMIFTIFGFGTLAGGATMPQKQAISATVTGYDQQVGFRAMVMKQAIEYNLAGSAKNESDEIVQFTLQGDQNRIDAAIAAIREGTKKSSNIKSRHGCGCSRPRFEYVHGRGLDVNEPKYHDPLYAHFQAEGPATASSPKQTPKPLGIIFYKQRLRGTI
jgi:acylphosphatase